MNKKKNNFNLPAIKSFSRKWLIILSILHAVFLVIATLWLLERDYTYGDEKFLIRWSSIIKKMVFKIDDKPPKSDFLFINTSYDNMLIDKLDEEGFPVGNQVITDRSELARLFGIISAQQGYPRYILCDIFFRDTSPNDSILNVNIKKIKNIIVPFHIDSEDKLQLPVFDVNRGLSDYNIIDGSFLKYTLLQNDSVRSIPLKMYEDITGTVFKKRSLFSIMNGKLSFNNIIIDFKVRNYDVTENAAGDNYPFVNLGEFLTFPDSVILQTVKNRIVLIGDIRERDFHSTTVGSMPGIMILLNVFLTLDSGENLIKPGFFLILFISYFLFSVDVFSAKNILDRSLMKKMSKYKTGKFLVKFVGYVLYLMLVSILIYLLYNTHINILLIAIYLKILDSFINYLRNEKRSEQKKDIISKLSGLGKVIVKLIKS